MKKKQVDIHLPIFSANVNEGMCKITSKHGQIAFVSCFNPKTKEIVIHAICRHCGYIEKIN